MDRSTEIKSRLSECLVGTATLEEFRSWFAEVLRTSRRYDESTQSLVWAIDFAFAKFGLGKWTRECVREYLQKIADSSLYVRDLRQYSSTIASTSINLRQEDLKVVLEESQDGEQPSSEFALAVGGLGIVPRTNEAPLVVTGYSLAI
jgi:hypothetical protein